MTEVQAALLALLSKALFGRETEAKSAEQTALLREAKQQAVLVTAYEGLDVSALQPEDAKRWQAYRLKYMANNLHVNHHHALLHAWLTQAGVSYVILKGYASAFYYPDPTARTMGDVDFLVPLRQMEKAGKVLESHGLKPWQTEHISHVVYRAEGMHFEMHFNLAGTPNGKAGDLVKEYTQDIYSAATVQKVDTGEAVLPSAFHHGLILLLHTCHHLTGEGVGLRHLCDWAVFANSLSDEKFRAIFEQKLKAIGLWKFAQVLTRASILYLGADEKAWASCDETLAAQLMEDILSGGNFGRKDQNRSVQTFLISDRGKDGVGQTGMSRELIRSVNELIYKQWPTIEKYKLLLPAGWAYLGGRRVLRVLMGKRKRLDIKQTVTGASERRDLYKQLALYEGEDL